MIDEAFEAITIDAAVTQREDTNARASVRRASAPLGGFLGVIWFMSGLYAASQSFRFGLWPAGLVEIAAFLSVFTVVAVVRPLAAARLDRGVLPGTLSITNAGITSENQVGRSEYSWSSFAGLVTARQSLVLVLFDRGLIIIPYRSLPDRTLGAVRAQLIAHVPTMRSS